VRSGGSSAQDSVGVFRDILDLHTRHGAIMAPQAPVRNRSLIGRSGRRGAQSCLHPGPGRHGTRHPRDHAADDAASIAVLTTAADLDLVAHEMTMLAEQAGRIVTPAARGPENT
jgi:hypothetical protein